MKPNYQDWKRLLFCFVIGFAIAFDTASGASVTPLAAILQELGKRVELFREQYPAVTCNERISQVKYGKGKDIISRQESEFDYLILMTLHNQDLHVEESRVIQKQNSKRQTASLLTTSGFSTLILIFHPLYQDSFEFLQLPEETIGGKRIVRIHYQHIPGTRSTTALRRESQNTPLDLKGDVWIEAATLAIVRITAELSEPLADLGLQRLNVDVHYAPIRFASAEGVYWLPSTASIEVATARQHWLNTHTFTDYRRFSVASESSIRR